MKTENLKTKTPVLSAFSKGLILTGAAALALFTLRSHTKKVSFSSSSIVPAARGSVKVKKDKNSNYRISIRISNLAESHRLLPPNHVYVVWMEMGKNSIKNIGQIKSATTFLSTKLKSSFETVSLDKPTKIFITAENDATNQYPDSKIVLTTKHF